MKPGWYPDPDDETARRYWDGEQWSAPLPAAAAESPEVSAEAADAAAPASGKRRRVLIAAGVAAVVVAAGVGVGGYFLFRDKDPGTFVVKGTMTLTDRSGYLESHPGYTVNDGDIYTPDGALGAECVGQDGYDDIAAGTDVIVSDDGGKTLALTELGQGHTDESGCRFPFTVEVPRGYKIYGIEVSHRGVVRQTADDMELGVAVTLG